MEWNAAAVFLFISVCVLRFSSADIVIQYSMDEEQEPGYRIGNLVEDSEIGNSYTTSVLDTLRFNLLPGPYKDAFHLDDASGVLYVDRKLDRDIVDGCSSQCKLSVEAAIVRPFVHFTVIHLEITIRDINDNEPRFSKDQFSLTVSENTAVGSSLLLPTASDPDSEQNAIQKYQLSVPHPLFHLELNSGTSNTGAGSGLYLVLQGQLDHETQTMYDLEVVASDGGNPSRSGTLAVRVQVVDANDNSPIFDQLQYNVTIQENQELYRGIITVHATDNDDGLNGQILYSLSEQTLDQYSDMFGLNNQTGELYLKRVLDYKMGTTHQLVVIARDMGSDSQKAHATVTIRVEDVNNHQPVITVTGVVTGQDIGVEENAAEGTIVAVISVQDLDPGINGRCSCEILDDNFRLEELYTNGYKVVSSQLFDRELQSVYPSVVQCHDLGTPSLTSQQLISVNIYDVNDNAPEFEFPSYQVNVQENSTTGGALLRVLATDQDQAGSDNAIVTYSLERAASTYLEIHPDSGVISLKGPLDYEMAPYLEFGILAQDQGFPSKLAQATLRIDVVDINDEAPVFSQDSYNFGTYENQPNSTEVGKISARDADSSPYDTFAYSFYGTAQILETFSINSADGMISTRHSLDRELKSVYTMVVIATNIYPPQQSASVSVTIYVADKNDNVPVISFPGEQNNSIDFSVYAPADYLVSPILASDLDLGTNEKLTYSLMNNLDLFSVDPVLGNIYVRASLQGVTDSTLDLHIVVNDNGVPPLSSTATLHINLNRTLAFAKEHGVLPEESFGGLSRHEEILVILGAITALLVSVLVGAIILVKRRQGRHSKQAFRCMQRVDYSEKLGSQNIPAGGALEAGTMPSGSDLWLDKGAGRSPADRMPPSYREVTHPGNNYDQAVPSGSNPGSRPRPCDYLGNPKDSPRTSSRLSSFMVKTNRDVDSDNASRCSAELSNTDSGHGPSEEGDAHEAQHPPGGTTRLSCPVHGSTDTGSIQSHAGSDISLPHLHGKRRHPSLKSHEQGMAGTPSNLPGVHGHRNQASISQTNNLNDPRASGNSTKLNNLSEKPPQRPPKAVRPLSSGYKPPPTNLWVNSHPFNTSGPVQGHTGTGPGSRGKSVVPSSAWVGKSSRIAEESDDDDSSSASSGSFVLNIGDIQSVDV